jgi:hypothetical protein
MVEKHAKQKNQQEEGSKHSLPATCFTLVSCLAYSSSLKMEATCSSETYVEFQLSVISQNKELLFTLHPNLGNRTTVNIEIYE